MKISVLGLGYIGLPTALLFAASGHEVVGVDIDKRNVELLSWKTSLPRIGMKNTKIVKIENGELNERQDIRN